MAMACGFLVSRMTIVGGGDYKGCVAWHITTTNTNEYDDQRSIAVFMAGMVADNLHWEEWGQGSANDCPLGWFDDRQRASAILEKINETEYMDAYIIIARRYLSRSDVWPIVSKVANALLLVGTIDGEDFIAGIADACPKIAPGYWHNVGPLKTAIDQLRAQDRHDV
jgi:hypothetical protein